MRILLTCLASVLLQITCVISVYIGIMEYLSKHMTALNTDFVIPLILGVILYTTIVIIHYHLYLTSHKTNDRLRVLYILNLLLSINVMLTIYLAIKHWQVRREHKHITNKALVDE